MPPSGLQGLTSGGLDDLACGLSPWGKQVTSPSLHDSPPPPDYTPGHPCQPWSPQLPLTPECFNVLPNRDTAFCGQHSLPSESSPNPSTLFPPPHGVGWGTTCPSLTLPSVISVPMTLMSVPWEVRSGQGVHCDCMHFRIPVQRDLAFRVRCDGEQVGNHCIGSKVTQV